MVNMQKQQELSLSKQEQFLFNQMELKFNAKLSVQKEESMRVMEALISDFVDSSEHYGCVIPNPLPCQGGVGAVMAPAAVAVGQRGHYEPHGEIPFAPNRMDAVSGNGGGAAHHVTGAQGNPQPGYLPGKVNISKQESIDIGLFMGGEDARIVWPGFHANFKHLAESYHWDYHAQGVLLARQCRGLALPVINSLPEKLRQDYKSIVDVFDKAYVPKEWARTYRGALNRRKQRQGESLLKYASALRELALTAFPCTEIGHTDKVREDNCLDQFLRGIRDPLMAIFVNKGHPETMEMAISAAEGHSAILSKDDIDLPGHPDKRGVDDDMSLSTLVAATAGDSTDRKSVV
jgi:hypothetical protein